MRQQLCHLILQQPKQLTHILLVHLILYLLQETSSPPAAPTQVHTISFITYFTYHCSYAQFFYKHTKKKDESHDQQQCMLYMWDLCPLLLPCLFFIILSTSAQCKTTKYFMCSLPIHNSELFSTRHTLLLCCTTMQRLNTVVM